MAESESFLLSRQRRVFFRCKFNIYDFFFSFHSFISFFISFASSARGPCVSVSMCEYAEEVGDTKKTEKKCAIKYKHTARRWEATNE